MTRLNCWEFKKCGKQSGKGSKNDPVVCPVTEEKRLDGTHGGTNAGRACWVVAGTLCGGQVQGTFAKKYANCDKCDFYQMVEKEEGPRLQLALFLLEKLKRG